MIVFRGESFTDLSSLGWEGRAGSVGVGGLVVGVGRGGGGGGGALTGRRAKVVAASSGVSLASGPLAQIALLQQGSG